ncbi:MAG: aminoacetone oxidase family FAD-binding enzyme [Clostridiales bacterium]|nr:aminoacetone oxidase family FAD-binding enzyme [Clostridiales bacterium]
MRYNIDMEKVTTAIIGGGAAGLMLAANLSATQKIAVFERGDRVGKKLSSTGNGQGNITNLRALETEYFTSSKEGAVRIEKILHAYDHNSLTEFFNALGVLLIADERDRVYPAGRQASSLTDALRFFVANRGVDIRLQSRVTDIKKSGDGFVLTVASGNETQMVAAENVVLCVGGKAAKNFGTDGSAYALAQKFGHTLTALYPSLVQLKTDTGYIKTLKGIRINDGVVTATVQKTGKDIRLQGDVIFTDYGVSGDVIFRLSAFLADEIEKGKTSIFIDFLPEFSLEKIRETLWKKHETFPDMPVGELLGGIVNNQVGRAIFKRANGNIDQAAALVKAFSLQVTGSLGFDYAQVTKGGVSLLETNAALESVLVNGLYFAGEVLDVDGQCGGFNLQWAYSSARTVADAINAKYARTRGQVCV